MYGTQHHYAGLLMRDTEATSGCYYCAAAKFPEYKVSCLHMCSAAFCIAHSSLNLLLDYVQACRVLHVCAFHTSVECAHCRADSKAEQSSSARQRCRQHCIKPLLTTALALLRCSANVNVYSARSGRVDTLHTYLL